MAESSKRSRFMSALCRLGYSSRSSTSTSSAAAANSGYKPPRTATSDSKQPATNDGLQQTKDEGDAVSTATSDANIQSKPRTTTSDGPIEQTAVPFDKSERTVLNADWLAEQGLDEHQDTACVDKSVSMKELADKENTRKGKGVITARDQEYPPNKLRRRSHSSGREKEKMPLSEVTAVSNKLSGSKANGARRKIEFSSEDSVPLHQHVLVRSVVAQDRAGNPKGEKPTPLPSSPVPQRSKSSRNLRKKANITYLDNDDEEELWADVSDGLDSAWVPEEEREKDRFGKGRHHEESSSDSSDGEDETDGNSVSDNENSSCSNARAHSPASQPEEHDQSEPQVRRAEVVAAEEGLSEDDLDAETTPAPSKTQKAVREENKTLRNSGQEYTTDKGKVIASKTTPRKIHDSCKLNCSENVSKENAQLLCSEYWAQSSYEKRKLYVASRVEEIPKQRSRPRVAGSKRSKENSCKYFLEINKKRVRVCRSTFLNVLCETDSFVRGIVYKKTTTGTIHPDKRGSGNSSKKMRPEKKQEVLDHIASYPKYVSHYCRKQSSQKFLPSHLNLEMMHRSYQKTVTKPLSYWSYRRIFRTLDLKFKPPNKDTCAKCDAFVMKIKVTNDETEKETLEKEKELHLRKAEAGYSLKRESRKKFEADPTKRVLIFDLEQCLPTPYLKCSEVYYKRQLYVFNLTIYDTSTKITHCYMWHEGESGRGANEISSCIFKHCLDEIPEEVAEVRLFSDSCTGQNKNSIVSAMFLALLQLKTSIKTIDHIFLVPGHTRLECDNKHSVIEKAKKTVDVLEVPADWYKLVDVAGRTNPDKFPDGRFKVVQMRNEFYNFADLLSKTGPLVKRELDEDRNRFRYRETFWFRYTQTNNFTVSVKASFNENAHFKTLNFLRNRKHLNSGLQLMDTLTRLRGVVPISEPKKKDLLELLKYISEEHHDFYKGLRTTANINQDYDYDLSSDNSDESENDA